MCRLLISVGRVRDISKYYEDLVNSLIRASEHDPHSIALFGPEDYSHRDGWGRLFIKVAEGNVNVLVRRSTKPIFVERPRLNIDGDLDSLYVDIVHSRASSIGMPINFFSIHPFESETRCGYKLYLVHNGAMHKDILLKKLGIKKDSSYAKLYTDSYFLAQYIGVNICDSITPDIIKEVAGYVDTGLNLGIVLVTDSYVEVMVGSYYRYLDKPKEMHDFYKVYKSILNETAIYVSSTLVDFDDYKPKLPVDWNEIENGKYDVYRIWFKENKLEHINSFTVR